MSVDLRPAEDNLEYKTNSEETPEKILNDEEDYDLEKWVNYTNLKIKEYKDEELEAFKKPFQIGWKRELSIRAQLHSSGKRIVDISYISPCNQVVLRSYVELGVYLRNVQDCALEPENFTFAKQPVYKYPAEIIRQLLKTVKHNRTPSKQNGVLQMPQLTPINDINKSSSRDSNNSLDSSFNNSVAEGRSRRKRMAPSRFDDEEYFDQSLIKKKIIKPQPTTPTSAKVQKSTLQLISPKNLAKKDQSVSLVNKISVSKDECTTKQVLENNLEDIESVKSNKSEQQTKQQLDANSNLLFANNEVDLNLKENTEDGDSNFSNKNRDENSQDQLIQQPNNLQPNDAPTVNNKSSKPRTKRKYVRSSMNTTSNNDLSNSLFNNSLLIDTYNSMEINSLLQNGNFECEDNDLSECELMIETKNTDPTLPIPPCSLICVGRTEFPSLRCSRCLCLFHPQCVRTGIFLKETKRFVCPNCVQPEDLQNSIKDSAKLFENANDDLDQDEPPPTDFQDHDAIEMANQISEETLNTIHKSTTGKTINQQLASDPLASLKVPPKIQKLVKQQSKMDNLNSYPKLVVNGLDGKKKLNNLSQLNLSNKIRLPPQLTRNLNAHHTNQRSMKLNPAQMQLNQMKQNQFNNQLLKKLNMIASHQQDLLSLKSNLTNGAHSGSSIASRKSHLENMNKSLNCSQQLIDSIKKEMNLLNLQHLQQQSLIFPPQNRLSVNNMRMASNNNMRLDSSYDQRYEQQRKVQHFINQNDPRQSKYLDHLNQNQNGLKQMIDQYKALDKIFSYLTVRDLVQCKLVNKTFNRLANEKHNWKRLDLKGLIVKDWEHFSSQILDANQAEELSLEGIRLTSKISTDQDSNPEDDLWKDFKSCFRYFQSLSRINFGKISIQNLAYLLANDFFETNDFNPLYDLEELSIKNLYDSSTSNFFSLELLAEKLKECKNLKSLRIESKQGISNDENTIRLLNSLAESLTELRSLYLPSLRGFTIKNFEFLTKLIKLECLEIGSCESWTLSNLNQEESEEQMDANDLEDQEDEFLSNENSNQENEIDNRFENQRNRSVKRHQGAFKYLSQLENLKELYLTDVIIDEMSNQLPLVLERMSNLESIGLGYVTVSPDATQTLNMLCNTLKNKLSLRKFSISTDDSHTNKCVFDLLLKRLDNLEELKWKVHTQVEDDGNCLVPFVKERGLESDDLEDENLDLSMNNDSVEMIETCFLNDILQKHLNKTKVFILPQ